MKPRALYHLMLIRARKLREEATPEMCAAMDAIAATLATDHNKVDYTVSWQWQGTQHSLTIPDKEFSFHVAGDTPQAVERRDNTRNYRQENWDRARQLWQQIGSTSGVALVPNSASDVMGLQPTFKSTASRMDFKLLLAMALGAALVTGIQIGRGDLLLNLMDAGITFLVAVMLFVLWDMLADTHLRSPLTPPVAATLAAGACLPAFWSASNFPSFFILFACCAICWVERRGYQATLRQWFAAGIAASLPVAGYGMVGAGFLLLLITGVMAASILVPARYIKNFDRMFVLGAVIGGSILMFLGTHIGIAFGFNYAGWITLQYGLGILLILIAALWWFHGTMSAFLAWWMLFAIGATIMLFALNNISLAALLAFSGLALAAAYEVVRAYRMSWIAERPIT